MNANDIARRASAFFDMQDLFVFGGLVARDRRRLPDLPAARLDRAGCRIDGARRQDGALMGLLNRWMSPKPQAARHAALPTMPPRPSAALPPTWRHTACRRTGDLPQPAHPARSLCRAGRATTPTRGNSCR